MFGIIEPSMAFRVLFDASVEFRDYYDAWAQRGLDVQWLLDTNLADVLHPGRLAKAYEPSNEEEKRTIFIQSDPASIDVVLGVHAIAHEMQRFASTDDEEFIKIIETDPEYEWITKEFRKIIEDPLIDYKLQESFHFNISPLLHEILENLIECLRWQVIGVNNDDSNVYETKLDLMLKDTSKLLRIGLSRNGDIVQTLNEYQLAYARANPNVSRMISDTLSLVPIGGLITHDKQRTFINALIRLYPYLNGKVEVVT
jgi:hypothetical protein